jgi:uroporphyrinogen III methyltransferase/synthase
VRAARRLVLTREPADNDRLREAVKDLGVEITDYPCIRVETLPAPAGLLSRVRAGAFAGAVFASRNGVESLFAQLGAAPAPADVVAIGTSTAEALLRHGWAVTGLPSETRAEVAALELDALLRSPGRVLVVRGAEGSHLLTGALRLSGREVEETVVYRTVDPIEAPLRLDERPTLVVFASPTAIRHFSAHQHDARKHPGFEALCIGPTTARAARGAGLTLRTARAASVAALAEAVREWARD